MKNEAVQRTVGRAAQARSRLTTCALGGRRLAAVPPSRRRAVGKILRSELPAWSRHGVGTSSGHSADQGGKEADSLGHLLGGERCEVGLRQLDLLIHVIRGACWSRARVRAPVGSVPAGDNLGMASTFPPREGSRRRKACQTAVPTEFPAVRGPSETIPAQSPFRFRSGSASAESSGN
jgi:hypothetical protein